MRPALPLAVLLTTAVAVPAVLSTADAKPRDRDRDGMPDRWEQRYGLDGRHGDARGDRDRDGLRNLAEYRARTNPRRRDSDRDGETDGQEHAGTVLSYADGVLSLALQDGSALTGKVTHRTEIECETPAMTPRHQDEDEDDDDQPRPTDDDHDEDDTGPTTTSTTTTGTTGTTGTTPSPTSPGPTVPGDDHDDDDQEGEDGDDRSCGTGGLVAGAHVRDAVLQLSARGRTFREVHLGRAVAPTPTAAPARAGGR